MSGSTPPPLSELLRSHRIRAGLSQEALAEASGISVRTVSDLERGQRASAHLETIRMLAGALGLTGDRQRQFLESAHPTTLSGAPDPGMSYRSGPLPARWAETVPRPASPLIGRVDALDALLAALTSQANGVVTLTGTGGVGKTRLAIEAAHRLAPSAFSGAAFVDLAGVRDAERVPDALARALAPAPQTAFSFDQLLAMLAAQDVLLVVDNFEQVVEAAPVLAQLSAGCPRLTMLVTSRVRLRLANERELALTPLALAHPSEPLDRLQANEANLLFTERARRVDPDFTLSGEQAVAVTQVCQRLDGLPLAIELAASRLRVLSLPALLERLDRRLPLLTGGDRDRAPHQQSMRQTIAWSYELLQPDEQRFFTWMSVFVGGLSLESAEALAEAIGMRPTDSLETLTDLVEGGLVTSVRTARGAPRFQMFETMREFGLEQLEATRELSEARFFHATYFLAFAERGAARPDQPIRDPWMAELSAERHNLLPAFDLLCRPESAELSLRFAAAMGQYWWIVGPFAEGRPRLLRAISLAPVEPTVAEVHARCWAAFLLADASDLTTALEMAHACIECAEQVGSPSDKAAALQALAWAEEHCEHWNVVRTLLGETLERWTELDNVFMQGMSLMLLGGIEYADGDLVSAERCERRAGELFVDIGEPSWAAGTYWYQGMIAVDAGQPARAVDRYLQCLRIWMHDEDSLRWFKPLVGLADVAASLGEIERAARLIGASDELLRSVGMELMPFDRPGYTRARDACRRALSPEAFDALLAHGRHMTSDAWLIESGRIVAAAQAHLPGET